MNKEENDRKIFVIDTSVLLYDKHSIHTFKGNDIALPLVVLDELDRHKERKGLVGENARYINRYLDGLRTKGSLSKGVYIEEHDINIRVLSTKDIDLEQEAKTLPLDFDNSQGDNKIILMAHALTSLYKDRTVVMVTKDINFRVKCDAVNVLAEDYYKDKVEPSTIQNDVREVFVPDDVINMLHSKKRVSFYDIDVPLDSFFPCEPLVFKGEINKNASSLVIAHKGHLQLATNSKMNDMVNVKPKNKEQTFAIDMLLDDAIKLVTLTGIAGSGKTFLALMAGLSGFYDGKFSRIVITRPIQAVGKDLGFLPGDLNDKMAPWIQPIVDNFRDGSNDSEHGSAYFETMRSKNEIEIAPLPYIRGRTFNNAFIIVDEAQNATIHELKTVITRVGQNSKIVLLGDVEQIDTPYLDELSNGLSITIDRFRGEEIAGHIRLPKGERSELATLASKIL